MTSGPLAGLTVVELASIGPVPFAGMVLSDMGADVIRVDKLADVPADEPTTPNRNVLDRGRRSIAVDLKQPVGVELVLQLVERSDAMIEGYRPGVAERIGLGPDACVERNPRLVYGRMTGWGQTGPLAARAGHDIDYIALAGALHSIGRAGQPPTPPLNVVGDFGGGGLLLAFGVVCALLEAKTTGVGQVVDAAMVDGTALLMAPFYAAADMGFWGERGTNMLDSGTPWYDVYECADGGWVAVGALEPQFYSALLEGLGLDARAVPSRDDPANWPALRELFTSTFRSRSRDEWAAIFAERDGCVAPVLSLLEAPHHPHNVARGTFVQSNGTTHPAPAPRFSRTVARASLPPCRAGEHTGEVLRELGLDEAEIESLRGSNVVA